MSFLFQPKPQVSSSSSSLLASSQMKAQPITYFPVSWKQKSPLTCKKDKKHQAFEMIFVCMDRDCENNLKPICAQCLHDNHSGHEVKLIKEIAESAGAFIDSERNKKQVSNYWEQLGDYYVEMYENIGGLVRYLQGVQDTLKRIHEEFFAKLNKEKEAFWEEVQKNSSNILKGEYNSEEELLQQVRLILKSVKLDDLENPQYRFNVLREETVLMVIENYKSIDYLVKQVKESVFSTLSENDIQNTYGAAEFRITEGNDYLKIASSNQNKVESRIVEVEEDGVKKENTGDCDMELEDNGSESEDFEKIEEIQNVSEQQENECQNEKNKGTNKQQKEETELERRRVTAQEIRMKYTKKHGNKNSIAQILKIEQIPEKYSQLQSNYKQSQEDSKGTSFLSEYTLPKSAASDRFQTANSLPRIYRRIPSPSNSNDNKNEMFPGKMQGTTLLRNEFTFTPLSSQNQNCGGEQEGLFDYLSFQKQF